MQDILLNPPNWLQITLRIFAAILSGIAIDRIYTTWLNRKKPTSEIHLTDATATEVQVRAFSQAGDFMGRMMDRLDAAQITIDGTREKNDKLIAEIKELKMRVDLMVIEADSLSSQLESAYAYIKWLGKHPTDVDQFRVNQKTREIDAREG